METGWWVSGASREVDLVSGWICWHVILDLPPFAVFYGR